jgi:hypothetical protein
MGYMRLEMGKNLLGIEGEIAWATPGVYTTNNFGEFLLLKSSY